MNILLLFDIDGTLVDTDGAGLESLREGFYASFPERKADAFPVLDLGGATDGSVVAFLFEHFEIENRDEHRETFFARYEAALEKTLARFREEGRGRALPGVTPLLEALARRREEFVMALLTGNNQSGARIKLSHFGLDRHFDFGAFGCDHPERNELGAIALRRARESLGREFSADRVVVIGDTLKDIACARACGARVLAVATGTVPYEELEAAGPDAILRDLSDTERALAVLEELASA